MDFPERFGRNLLEHRERLGISQEELGMRAELHRTAVGQLERAQRIPRADTVIRLAGSLGIPSATLFEGVVWEPSIRTAGALIVAEVDQGIRAPERGGIISRKQFHTLVTPCSRLA